MVTSGCGMNTCGTTSSKSEIISLLSDINREGIGNVIAYLEHSDYFSTHPYHHHRFEGGLAEHSLGVYWEMRAFAPDLPDESCRIVALFHDLCTTHLEGYDAIGYHHHGQRSVDLLDALGFVVVTCTMCRHMNSTKKTDCGISCTFAIAGMQMNRKY